MALARHFASLHWQELDGTCEQALLHYGWPGNVRELRHSIERAATLASNGCLHAIDIVHAIDLGLPEEDFALINPLAGGFERVLEGLAIAGWNADRAARSLGIGRTTLFRRLKGRGFTLRGAREYHESRYGTGTRGTLAPISSDGDQLSDCPA